MPAALKTYKQKRDFKKTNEPSGAKAKAASAKKLTFVIQKHDASHLHYDFRLEAGGRLISWAVPKGPSLDTSQKRLAVHVEDHPLDYANFEGHIPEGQYGGGDVIVWDNGTYTVEGLESESKATVSKAVLNGVAKGKLTIVMSGKKVKGSFSLVQLKNAKSEKNWLLIKGDDQFASDVTDLTDDDSSVISKKKLADPSSKAPSKSKPKPKVSAKIKAKTAEEKTVVKKTASVSGKKLPKMIEPMLASLATEAFSKDNWIFEPKFDGIRAIAYIFENQVKLLSRNGMDITAKFPVLIKELSKLNTNMIIDGEIVALNEKGVPSFETLQARSLLMSKNKSAGPTIKYFVFDIIQAGSESLLDTPLEERLVLLKKHVQRKNNKDVQVVQAYEGDGTKAFKTAIKEGMEGVVGKSLTSIYTPGKRSPNWLKVKDSKSSEFVICGYSAGEGARDGYLGALIIAENKNGELKYAGKVGTGFNTSLLKELTKRLNKIKVAKSPVTVPKEYALKATWVRPELVAEIKYSEKTKQGLLRAPVFMHLREDIDADNIEPEAIVKPPAKSEKQTTKGAKTSAKISGKISGKSSLTKSTSKKQARNEIIGTESINELIEQLDEAGESLILRVDEFEVKFSHLDKVFWPDKKNPITKRDYVKYLLQVSPYLLNHLHNRPFTLIRLPDGIGGQRFFQKHQQANSKLEFLETIDLYSGHAQSDGEFLLCNNLATLAWCAQMAGLEIHASHTRIEPEKNLTSKSTGSLKNIESSVANYPDYLVLDLDPYIYSGKEKANEEPELHRQGFKKTCQSALWLKEILDQLKLNAFIKTSGKTGLHIYIPIERNMPYDAVRSCCETLGKHLLAAHPKEITMEWSIKKRPGKIFFDHNMNARGKTLPAPYSLRSSVQATASMPLDWEKLDSAYPTDFTLHTVPEILASQGDIWQDILEKRNDLKKKLNLE